ncbi:MAG: hypothetical protein ACOX3G_04610 [Armatimonadota bacterium]
MALQLAIAMFAIYLLVRRLVRLRTLGQDLPPHYIADIPANAKFELGQMITVAWCREIEESERLADMLHDEGIDTALSDKPPQVKVPSQDARRAIEILKED